jgi:hypothetical protein
LYQRRGSHRKTGAKAGSVIWNSLDAASPVSLIPSSDIDTAE